MSKLKREVVQIGKLIFKSVFVLACFCLQLRADLIPQWPIKKLHDESDLAIIAVPTKSGATGQRKKISETKAFELEELKTDFKVIAVNKGKYDQITISMHHYRLKEVNQNFPGVLETAYNSIDFEDYLKQKEIPEIMLYLKRIAGNRFEPISGIHYPEKSVFVLNEIKPAR